MKVKDFKINPETQDLEMKIVLIGISLTAIGLFSLLQMISHGEHPFIGAATALFLALITSFLWHIFTPQTYMTFFMLLVAGFLYLQF